MSGFFGRKTVTTDNDGITVDSVPGTLTAGDYYIYSPVNAECFLKHLTTVMSTLSGKTITYSINSSTGKVTLSCASTFSISGWETYDWAGFSSGAMSGSNSYTGTKAARYSWLPGVDPAEALSPVARPGTPIAYVAQTRTLSGAIHTSRFATLTDQELTFRFIANAKTWKQGAGDYSSLEEFWGDVLSVGGEMIYIPGYPTDTATYHYYKPRCPTGELRHAAAREIPGSDTWWKFGPLALYAVT